MAEQDEDEEDLKWTASAKARWDTLAKKGLASGNDRWVTEASRRKADIDDSVAEWKAERKKEKEITDRIFAAEDKEAILTKLKELKVIDREEVLRELCRVPFQRLFPSKKQRSS